VPGPLQRLRILDASRVLTGPFCSMILGDLGAEVIKIERPGTGDDTREWGLPFIGSESAYFLSVNRNKKSITLDLDTTEGKRIFYALVAKSDALLENFTPGVTEKLQID
jgi:succinate--hydroxymethylglutarate CoA-transferase